ncbi:MAG TPA: hypothetical protein ENK10_05250, partial [Acidobacteria bacterium]|nr:hypothetical protein [Acidobacteriota bacterium]
MPRGERRSEDPRSAWVARVGSAGTKWQEARRLALTRGSPDKSTSPQPVPVSSTWSGATMPVFGRHAPGGRTHKHVRRAGNIDFCARLEYTDREVPRAALLPRGRHALVPGFSGGLPDRPTVFGSARAARVPLRRIHVARARDRALALPSLRETHMQDRVMVGLVCRVRLLALVLSCLLAASGTWGLAPRGTTGTDEVVIRVVSEAVGRGGLSPSLERDLLKGYGVSSVEPVFRGRNLFRSRLARYYRLHRYYKLRFEGGVRDGGIADRLEADPRIEYAAAPGCLRPGGFTGPATNDTYFGEQWDIENSGQQGGKPDADIDAVEAYALASGDSRVVVAVLDFGVDGRQREVRRRIVPFGDAFCCGRPEPYDPQPINGEGHGTRAAGIVLAASDNGFGIAGIDKWGMLMPSKVGEDGLFDDLSIADGLEAAADHGVEVVNMSLSGLGGPVLEDAVRYAFASGVVLVASAGNAGTPVVGYPAAYPEVIAVGATTRFDELDPFS